ncbi:MAG: hypothetical protein NTW21_19570 [Verrucomicrobia bacterium]|nr:hypothetical protein [Verrucomicrobiota bacterium]
MNQKLLVIVGLCLVAYVVGYLLLRSYSAVYAPYAWGRGYETTNPTPSTIHYPVFSKAGRTNFEQLVDRFMKPIAYYVFSPLVEGDLAIHNHPANPNPKWEFYGNNWPK